MSTQTAKTRFAAPGGGGGGAAITVQEEGAPVVVGVNTLNFTGGGVTASNAGGGVAQITVPSLAVEEEGIIVDSATTTLNFIGAGVTASSGGAGIIDVTIPETSTVISGLYFVAGNGNDVTGNGSLTKPFLTIQAAINKAALDGHTFGNEAEILVLPKNSAYAPFATLNGINVKGLANDNQGVKVGAPIIVQHDATGFSTNVVEISNLFIDASGTGSTGIAIVGPNAGSLTLNNLKIIPELNQHAVLAFQASSVTTLNNVNIFPKAGSIFQAVQVFAGSMFIYNSSHIRSNGFAAYVNPGASLTASNAQFSTGVGSTQSTLWVEGSASLRQCNIINDSVNPGCAGLEVQNGATATLIGCSVSVTVGQNNFTVAAGGILRESLLTYSGAGVSESNFGTITTLPIYNLPTEIDGLYYVSGNGNDAVASGSITNPFATIQAAINKAVADGHGFSNQAEVLVLPKNGSYSGFTTANGVNVKGVHGDRLGVIINGTVVIAQDASGFATNSFEMSNLTVDVTGLPLFGLDLSGPNSGSVFLRNCKIVGGLNFEGIYFNQSGSQLVCENVAVSTSAGTTQVLNIQAGTLTFNNSSATGQGPALLLAAVGVCKSETSSFVSYGNNQGAIIAAGQLNINNAVVINYGAGVNDFGIEISGGGNANIFKSELNVQSALAPALFLQFATVANISLINFSGVSQAVSNFGILNTVPLIGAGYIPNVPGDWAFPAPLDLASATDRLASAVAGLLGGPIP